MVNKPHAPRNKPGKKATPVGLEEDTSFIVFGNDKGKKKSKQTPDEANTATSSKTKSKDAANAANASNEAPKKPDTRTLVAGASWTGKLPMTLLNELCQKQKWERPEYVVDRIAKGYVCKIILRQKNPKTQEVTQLPVIAPPREYQHEQGVQPSPVEARHFGAAYALYRLRNATSMHTTLPPQYRDLWKTDFADLKKEAIEKGRKHEYEADPFAAYKQQQETKATVEKHKIEQAKQKADEKKAQIVGLDGKLQDKHALRGWSRVPKIEMGVKTRSRIEQLVRSAALWNPHQVKLSDKEQSDIVDDLLNSGFRRSHIQEAAAICKDKEECLEWLLIHVPEDDLPGWALPENYLAGVSLATGDLKRENILKRLGIAGFSKDICAEVFDACNGDEGFAAPALQDRLLGTTGSISATNDAWREEQETLSAIFGEKYIGQGDTYSVQLELEIAKKSKISLNARPGSDYPHTIPILAIDAALPAYIRLSILRKCLIHAQQSLLGEHMIFSIVDWLENEIPKIIEEPGRLADVASAIAELPTSTSSKSRSKTIRHPKAITWTANTANSQKLQTQATERQTTPEQQRMMLARQSLPAWKLRDAVVQSVTQNQVTIISGETGSGKSTQSVQFILDDLLGRGLGEHANIICTQPRRISALGLADRVSDERCGKVGDEIGYVIRGESKQKSGVTKICFVTTGVLLRRLQTSGGKADDVLKSLADVSHIVIDEVHERSLDTDFLLILIRDVLRKRKDLRLILMSATLDSDMFKQYFSGSTSVGMVEIAGRTHPVTDIYLDEVVRSTGFGMSNMAEEIAEIDEGESSTMGKALRTIGMRINYELIAETVRLIDHELGMEDGGILIFLPGVAEIDQTIRALRSDHGLHVLPLHASLQSNEQRRVFAKPPKGLRKVVAATNVAETSITIDDIVAVIDTGRVKETSFDPANNMVKLAEVWASKAACKQRRGRAGRVRAGTCYKLYTRSAEAKMADRPEPEIRRVPLEQLCLAVRAMGILDVSSFIASALTPPESNAVAGALSLLSRMGFLDGKELTALGKYCSQIPADLRCAKLIVYGAAFGCLDACLRIAAILTSKSPFVSPKDKRDDAKAARSAFDASNGDLLCDLKAFEEWNNMRSSGQTSSALRRWCDDNFLNQQTLFDISTNCRQLESSLGDVGIASASVESHRNDDMLRALIAGAFQPQIARIDFPDKKFAASSSGTIEVDPEARTIKFYDEDNSRLFVHPSSTLFDAHSYPGDSKYMSFFNKMATSKTFIRDLTPFNIYSLLMFSGPITIDPQGRGLLVDGWIRVKGWARIGVLVSRLRMMLDDLLARKIDDPGFDLSQSDVVGCVKKLIELNGMDR